MRQKTQEKESLDCENRRKGKFIFRLLEYEVPVRLRPPPHSPGGETSSRLLDMVAGAAEERTE